MRVNLLSPVQSVLLGTLRNKSLAGASADCAAAFGKGDAAALVAQYADDALFATPFGMMRGVAEIRPFVEQAAGEFQRPGAIARMRGLRTDS